jgi:hypothetical protein
MGMNPIVVATRLQCPRNLFGFSVLWLFLWLFQGMRPGVRDARYSYVYDIDYSYETGMAFLFLRGGPMCFFSLHRRGRVAFYIHWEAYGYSFIFIISPLNFNYFSLCVFDVPDFAFLFPFHFRCFSLFTITFLPFSFMFSLLSFIFSFNFLSISFILFLEFLHKLFFLFKSFVFNSFPAFSRCRRLWR